jgi:hypothetical protein
MIAGAALAAALLVAAPPTLYGNLITSWGRVERGNYTASSTQYSGFAFDQAGLGLAYRANDWIDLGAGLTFTGNSVTLSQATLRFSGLPLDGAVTLGRFYKPLGAPIPLATLSMPAIMLHSAPEYGIKLNAADPPFEYELGIVNGNPLVHRDYSASVGNSAVLTTGPTPNTMDPNSPKDVYGRVAYVAGEDWGSLTTGVTYTEGRLSTPELNFLTRGAKGDLRLFHGADRKNQRHHLIFDLDFQRGPWRFFGEYANARDGRLRRKILAVAGSRTFYPSWGAMTATIAFDRLRHNVEIIRHDNPISWPRDRYSLALSWQPHEILQWQAQYDFNEEKVRDSMGRKVENDAFKIQSILYF